MTASTLCFFGAMSSMPLAEVSAIVFTSPLLVTLLSRPVLGERVRPANWIAAGIGFAGMLIILRPGSAVFSWAILLPVASAFLFAFYQMFTRKLTGVDASLTTLFYPAAVGTAVFSLAIPVYWTTPQSPADIVLFACMGVFGGCGHFILIRAFEYATAAALAPLQYLHLVGVTVLGYLVFGDFPDQWAMLGMAIIVASGVFIASQRRMLSDAS